MTAKNRQSFFLCLFLFPTLVSLLLLDLTPQFAHSFPTELSEETKELLNWEAPYEIRKNFPYFLSGYDADGSPVWVVEFGRWDIRTVMESDDKEKIRVFEKYLQQCYTRIFESPRNVSRNEEAGEDPIEDFVVIEDADGYGQRQFSHPPTLAKALFILRGSVELERVHGQRLKQGYSINNNFIAASVWNLAKPVLGEVANRIQVLGTNADKWKPILHRHVPRSALPEWLGGHKNHTPIHIYG